MWTLDRCSARQRGAIVTASRGTSLNHHVIADLLPDADWMIDVRKKDGQLRKPE